MSSTGVPADSSKKRERPGNDATEKEAPSKAAKTTETQLPVHQYTQNDYYQAYAGAYAAGGYPMNYSQQAYAGYPGYDASQYYYQYPANYAQGYQVPAGYYQEQPSHSSASSRPGSSIPAAPSGSAVHSSSADPLALPAEHKKEDESEEKKKLRYAAGKVWEDDTLADWPENDFRIYVGNLAGDTDDRVLHDAFQKYATLAHWKVIRDKKYDTSRGYGFVSFLDPREGVRALKEMNGKYIGSRICKLTKSTHERRDYKTSAKSKPRK